MATRTKSATSKSSGTTSRGRSSTKTKTAPRATAERESNTSGGRGSSERSAFSFGNGNSSTGALVGAALAGAAIGFAANYGRKLLMQGMEAMAGDWDVILANEHEMTLAIFDKMLATDETQTFKRKMLLMKLTHALDKHAHQEEMVVYPALREAGIRVEADQLEHEHGEVKTFLYELQQMGGESPNWIERVREFRDLVSRHAHMEEEEVFPSFKRVLTEEQDAKITSLVNRDGFWQA
ncbi:hemerythrin domain-containing protein [Sphingomonas sinipercae]|uniref:Hemerythrin domain-containing protein n=1 Tax=Sphingomonas sinipercae TaxID=2714944 RepID=A0A6G7ZNP5_9SPHN|nr:hemerythrin domain-containing protein [Sphingomonas sinipercae]QIL02539.1 hemerythrin domain-containing protein [Sphingomonas sinipercae]